MFRSAVTGVRGCFEYTRIARIGANFTNLKRVGIDTNDTNWCEFHEFEDGLNRHEWHELVRISRI